MVADNGLHPPRILCDSPRGAGLMLERILVVDVFGAAFIYTGMGRGPHVACMGYTLCTVEGFLSSVHCGGLSCLDLVGSSEFRLASRRTLPLGLQQK